MLADQQALFFKMLTGEASAEEIDQTFVGSREVPLEERVAVYAEAYVWRQILALREDFAVCYAIAADAFDDLARDFVFAKPSPHPSLAKRGEGFAEFLKSRGQAMLADMAALEWARAWIFEAAKTPLAEARVMQAPGIETKTLRLVAALALVTTAHEITPAWSAINHDEEVGPPAVQVEQILVWRKDFDVFHRPLPSDEAEALKAAARGATVSEICEAFSAADDPTARAFAALSGWFQEGLVAR